MQPGSVTKFTGWGNYPAHGLMALGKPRLRSTSEIAEDAVAAMVENDTEWMLELAIELDEMGDPQADSVLWHAAFVEGQRGE